MCGSARPLLHGAISPGVPASLPEPTLKHTGVAGHAARLKVRARPAEGAGRVLGSCVQVASNPGMKSSRPKRWTLSGEEPSRVQPVSPPPSVRGLTRADIDVVFQPIV